ncbi:MAG: hypothetical protein KC434_21290, partial [Anaerolineales bacterium]|nr:hypothetical protein [Anaerolineales bacterium]
WAVRLRGRLDRDALQVAVDALVARHAVLRTRFVEDDGVATQQVLKPEDIPAGWISAEFLALNGRDPQQAAAEYLQGLHFELATGPLWQLRVLEIAPDDQLLVLAMHHIITDGWSLSVLNRELATAYQAALHGTAPDWDPLPLQYADYARWQADWLASGELAQQLDFWREALQGAPALLSLPADQPRESAGVAHGAWHH